MRPWSRVGLLLSVLIALSRPASAGVGAASGGARWGTLRRIALLWFTTLPLAAVLAALCPLLLRRIPV